MTPMRLAPIASGLVGAFLVSVAAGGFLARYLNSSAAVPPVAVVSPGPGASSTPFLSITAPPVGPTAIPPSPPSSLPQPSGAPIETATPVVTPTAPTPTGPATSPPASSPSASPNGAPTTTPTGQPSGPPPTATPTSPLDPATAEEFASDLAAAIRDGQNEYLLDRLHPATIDRYGLPQCRTYIRDTISGSDITWEVQGSTGPTSWDYITDGATTTIPDAWAVTVRQPGADPEIRDLHFAPFEGTWRWFTDCGDPI
jgi:hypothetical protein